MTKINWGWLFAFLGTTAFASTVITACIPNQIGFVLSISVGVIIGGFGVR